MSYDKTILLFKRSKEIAQKKSMSHSMAAQISIP